MQKGNPLLTFEFYKPYLLNGLQVAFILLLAYLSTLIVLRAIRTLRKYSVRMMLRAGGHTEFDVEKRAETITGVIRKSVHLLIWAVAFMMVLQKLGFAIAPLLASLGLVGVAVGFGALNLGRRFFAWVFVLFEKPILVYDAALSNASAGLVKQIHLHT